MARLGSWETTGADFWHECPHSHTTRDLPRCRLDCGGCLPQTRLGIPSPLRRWLRLRDRSPEEKHRQHYPGQDHPPLERQIRATKFIPINLSAAKPGPLPPQKASDRPNRRGKKGQSFISTYLKGCLPVIAGSAFPRTRHDFIEKIICPLFGLGVHFDEFRPASGVAFGG